MTGKRKIGLDYFAHDTDAFSDLKIRKLIKRKGAAAYAVYVCLLCQIYRQGYYLEWDDELAFIIAEQTGAEEDFCTEVINSSLNVGLFDTKMWRKHKVLTSSRIQDSYRFYCKQAKRICDMQKYIISPEKKHISSEEMKITSEDINISSENFGRNDTKRIERKRKELSPPSISPSPLQERERKEGGDFSSEARKNDAVSGARLPRKEATPPTPSQPHQAGHSYFALYKALKGNIGETDARYEEDTIWECMRLTGGGRTDSVGVPLIRMWLDLSDDQKRTQPFYLVVQNLQAMEREGTIRCECSHNEYFMRRWLRANIGMDECRDIEARCRNNQKLVSICMACIKEIESKGDKIKMPGRFILSRINNNA